MTAVSLRKTPTPLPTRAPAATSTGSSLSPVEQAAVNAAQYVAGLWWQEDRETPVRVIDWRGHPSGSAFAPISERATLTYTPGGAITSLTVRVLCDFGVRHERRVVLPGDLDAALTAAETCTAHADPKADLPGVDDLAILRLIEAVDAARKVTTNA